MKFFELLRLLSLVRWGEQTDLGDGLVGRRGLAEGYELLSFEGEGEAGERPGVVEVYRENVLLSHYEMNDLEG